MARTPGLILMLAAAGMPMFCEVLDRIAVTVDQQIITESDIVTDLRVIAFLDHKPADLSAQARREDAGRLVDQLLILDEAADSHFILPSEADAAAEVGKEKADFSSLEAYTAALAQNHVTEADLTAHFLAGLRALRFTDLRFRPEVQISDQDLRTEYEKRAVEWRKSDPGHVPTFEASRDQLEELLTGDRAMQALDQWLAMSRKEHQVDYREGAFQ